MKHYMSLVVNVEMTEDAYDEWIESYGSVDNAVKDAMETIIRGNEDEDTIVKGYLVIDGVCYE